MQVRSTEHFYANHRRGIDIQHFVCIKKCIKRSCHVQFAYNCTGTASYLIYAIYDANLMSMH